MFDLPSLIDKLHVTEIDKCLFKGTPIVLPLPKVFGGQVLAQSLNAAFRTVTEDRRPHSMHAYFLRPGDMSRDIIYEVDPIRDGGSFSTRRVLAKQNGEAIFSCSVSFHKLEKSESHQIDMPKNIPHPETLDTEEVYFEKLKKPSTDGPEIFHLKGDAIDIRPLYGRSPYSSEKVDPVQGFWFKFNSDIGDDPVMHRTLLAFISDYSFMSTGLLPLTINFTKRKMMGASLDHAMWFHCDIKVDQWIYYHMDSPRSARARDFNRGSFYTEKGLLIASTAQEGLFRILN